MKNLFRLIHNEELDHHVVRRLKLDKPPSRDFVADFLERLVSEVSGFDDEAVHLMYYFSDKHNTREIYRRIRFRMVVFPIYGDIDYTLRDRRFDKEPIADPIILYNFRELYTHRERFTDWRIESVSLYSENPVSNRKKFRHMKSTSGLI